MAVQVCFCVLCACLLGDGFTLSRAQASAIVCVSVPVVSPQGSDNLFKCEFLN